jgi:hypothetical protein
MAVSADGDVETVRLSELTVARGGVFTEMGEAAPLLVDLWSQGLGTCLLDEPLGGIERKARFTDCIRPVDLAKHPRALDVRLNLPDARMALLTRADR